MNHSFSLCPGEILGVIVLMSLIWLSIWGSRVVKATQYKLFSEEEIPSSKDWLSAVLLILISYFVWTSTTFPWFRLVGGTTSAEH